MHTKALGMQKQSSLVTNKPLTKNSGLLKPN